MTSSLASTLDFTGRRVLVTGGGRGIGLAIVKLFVELKAQVIVFDIDQTLLDKLSQDLPTVTGVKVDLSDWEATKKATEAVLPIHHLVNNAVLLELRDVLDIDEKMVDRTFAVDFKAVLNLSQVVAKGLIQNEIKDGTIVNMSSIADSMVVEQTSLYSAAKAALVMLSKNLALELGQFGIRVNYVRPAIVNTELLTTVPRDVLNSVTKKSTDRMTFKRLIEPSEVARTVVFLSSPWSTMVTGTAVTIDGGFTLS